jgi:4-hydroxythreonine-4-phosphate dehydrogenase
MAMPGDKKTDGLPRVAVSAGDSRGVGPEVSLAAVRDPRVLAACRPVLYWHAGLDRPRDAGDVVVCGRGDAGPARAALDCLEASVDAVRAGEAAALVTAPVSKERTAAVLPGFRGHTEWLAGRASVDESDVVMIFSGPRVRTACVTRHVALSAVPGSLSIRDIAWSGLLLWGHLHWELGIASPRLAVCGVNPHASDGGILGHEEERVIAPAVDDLRAAVSRLGGATDLVGPVAADAAYREHVLGRHDGVLAMFHDQATVAAKLADPFLAVNLTAGLPFVRTSPDHGTADDLASTGRADHRSMREAILLAARIASCRSGLRHRLDDLRAALRG